MAVVAVNIWTGAPLLALWIGSRVQGDGPPTMGAIFAVVGCLLVGVLGLARLLAALGAAHEAATGHQSVRRHVPWLRSMRGERERYAGDPIRLSALDRTLVVVVVVAVIAFEIWFFFFSSSPIDQRSGRAALPATSAQQGSIASSWPRSTNTWWDTVAPPTSHSSV
jgi:hypothetical protein